MRENLSGDDFTRAVAHRFEQIRNRAEFDHLSGDFCYDGSRCAAENLGWRARMRHGATHLNAVRSGEFDHHIAATYHDAASAEHWYRFDKDYGDDYYPENEDECE